MKFPPPLRFAIPAILLLFGLASGWIYFWFERGRGEQALEASVVARARHLGGTLAEMCPFLLERKLPEGAQRAVALSMNQRNLRVAHVVDGDRKVMFSTREDLVGLDVMQTSIGAALPLVEGARKMSAAQIETAPGGAVLAGAFPFALAPGAAGSFTPGTGVVLLEYDLSTLKAAARASELKQFGIAAGILVALCAAFSFLFHKLLMSRVRRLADASASLAAGHLDARAGIVGGDELAALSEAFDKMAVQLQAHDASLRESEARFRFLVESIPQVFWLTQVSPECVLYVAPTFEKIWGFKVQDLYRNPRLWVEAIHADDRGRVHHAFERWLAGRSPTYDVNYRIVRPDGETRWIRDRGTYLDQVRGEQPRRVAGFAEDVSDAKRAGDEREGIERKLQDSQRLESLGVLAGGIAHDFNNLLTGMLGNASLARMTIPQSDEAQKCLAEIESTAKRAAELCKEMLAYSGKGRFEVKLLDLNSLVRDTTQLLHLSIAKGATLRFHLAESLSPVLADSTQMRQVLMNFVINASEALEGNSGVIKISTGLTRVDRVYLASNVLCCDVAEGDYVYLEVADTGCGMTPEACARIFEPFYTTKSASRGLGLSAVLGIARAHKGALKVRSQVGKGTTFSLLLPGAKGEGDAPVKPGGKSRETGGKGTVLVVDDEEIVRTVTARAVQAFGFTPLVAVDGQEGIERFEAARKDIVAVLLDLTMPRMDGVETFRRLREIDPGIPVILMSGGDESDVVGRFAGCGLSGFLQKPFTPDAMIEKLRSFVGPNGPGKPAHPSG